MPACVPSTWGRRPQRKRRKKKETRTREVHVVVAVKLFSKQRIPRSQQLVPRKENHTLALQQPVLMLAREKQPTREKPTMTGSTRATQSAGSRSLSSGAHPSAEDHLQMETPPFQRKQALRPPFQPHHPAKSQCLRALLPQPVALEIKVLTAPSLLSESLAKGKKQKKMTTSGLCDLSMPKFGTWVGECTQSKEKHENLEMGASARLGSQAVLYRHTHTVTATENPIRASIIYCIMLHKT